ncbi:PAS domain S-box protein [bacterium]|nr:MAG: PAS domain S-box protein [bacterium]
MSESNDATFNSSPISVGDDPLGSPLSRSIFDAAAEGLLVLSKEGFIIAVNPAFCTLYGISADDVVGRHHSVFTEWIEVHRFDRSVAESTWVTRRALGGEAVAGVLQTIHNKKSGSGFIARCGAKPLLEYGRFVSTTITVEDVTEATRAQQSLEGALSAAEVGTYRVDLVARRVWGDANFARVYGLTEEEVQGGPLERLYQLAHPDDVERVRATVREATRTGEQHEVEYRVVLPQGGIRWILSRGRAELDESGAAIQRIGSILDISIRRAALEAVRESAERFRLLVESVPEIAWTATPEGHHDYYNERWYETTGRERKGEDWTIFLHPEDREKASQSWDHSVSTGLPFEFETRLWETRTGTYRWFLARARPLCDDEGRIVRWFGVTSDIHDQKTKERSLEFLTELSEATRPLREASEIVAACQERLGEHLGVSRCAYAEVAEDEDTFKIVQDWSPSLPSTVGMYSLHLFGRSVEVALRSGRTTAVDDVDRDLASGDGRETFNAIGIKSVVCCSLIKGGRLVALMALHMDRPRAWTREEIRLLEAVADRCWAEIERARAERELRELNQELEARVRERTEELTRANRDLNEFSYSVAHDLRSPLRAIVTSSRILLEDAADRLNDEERHILQRQAANSVRLAGIVDDLLSFARLAQAEIRREPFDMTRIACQIASDVSGRGWQNAPRIQVQEGMRSEGDPILVGYALTNLLDNACKFSPQGGVVRVGEKEGVFYVQDQGVGFDMAHADRLFVAFERLVDQESFAGTGVGLANVRRIVERHGGRIWAESEPGKGATFWFTL